MPPTSFRPRPRPRSKPKPKPTCLRKAVATMSRSLTVGPSMISSPTSSVDTRPRKTCTVWGLRFRIWSSGFRDQGLGFGVWGLGSGSGVSRVRVAFRITFKESTDSGFRVSRLRGRVSGFEFWGSGFRISGSGFRSYGFGVRATSKESTRARVEERTSSQDASNGQPWCPSTCSVHN
jgi:hypothetical protein